MPFDMFVLKEIGVSWRYIFINALNWEIYETR